LGGQLRMLNQPSTGEQALHEQSPASSNPAYTVE
jgi:hypothetical protein